MLVGLIEAVPFSQSINDSDGRASEIKVVVRKEEVEDGGGQKQ